MNVFGQLVKSLVYTHDESQDSTNRNTLLLQYRTKLEWTVAQFKNSEEDYPATLGALLHYVERNNRCPPTFIDLKTFIEQNPGNNQTLVKQLEIIMTEIEMLEEDVSETSTDIEMLMRTAFDKGAGHYDTVTYENAARIAAGEIVYPSKTDNTGPTVARIFVSDRQVKRMSNIPKGYGGDFVKNLPAINRELDLYLGGADKFRIPTGFESIDSKVLIGPKHQKWIGLLGYTNHGKSGYLMSMLYNMALGGAKVLFVPREFPVMDAWQRFLWMHAYKFPDEPLIDLHQWKGNGLSNNGLQPWRTKNKLSEEMFNGALKGSIECQKFSTWEEIEEHLLVRSYKDPVDVLAIDYIGHLQVSGKNEAEEMNKIFRKAQMLTQNGIQNDGNGNMVVITPLQANKKHYEVAGKAEGDDWGIYSAAAVDYYSQAARDMDLLLGIWSEGPLKLESPQQAKVYCIKSRGEVFAPHNVQIDGISRYYHDISATKEHNIEIADAPKPKEPANEWENLS